MWTWNWGQTGRNIFDKATTGGSQALGRKTGKIEVGYKADLIVIDNKKTLLATKKGDELLDSLIFSKNYGNVRDVFISGKPIVENRKHKNEEFVKKKFISTLKELSL